MATRSTITTICADGKYRSIYCHWDGYPSNNGAILLKHYSSTEAAEALVSLGSLSVLAPSIECPEGHSFDSKVPGHCVAYHRDRGEALQIGVGDTPREAVRNVGGKQQYNYIRDGNGWTVNGYYLPSVLVVEASK